MDNPQCPICGFTSPSYIAVSACINSHQDDPSDTALVHNSNTSMKKTNTYTVEQTNPKTYSVTNQTGQEETVIDATTSDPHCTCTDDTGECKHIISAKFWKETGGAA